jgi:Holliday junction DNA helicase RuvB
MELIGHTNTKQQINVASTAAKARNQALPHMLFSGHAGCGKTSMAKYVANMRGANFLQVQPKVLKDVDSVLKVMDELDQKGYDKKGNRVSDIAPTILFIDEVHGINLDGQEALGIAMEEFKIPAGNRGLCYWIPYFTVVGATTLEGNLSKPFLDRFKMKFLFQPYSFQESVDIVLLHAYNMGITITAKAARNVAKRGRGVPRILVRYLERLRDMAYSCKAQIITDALAEHTFEMLGIDREGLNKVELKVLRILFDADQPIGLDNLAIVTGESTKTLKDTVEPFLIQRGLMLRSGKGRVLTKKGRQYLQEEGYAGNVRKKVEIPLNYERT